MSTVIQNRKARTGRLHPMTWLGALVGVPLALPDGGHIDNWMWMLFGAIAGAIVGTVVGTIADRNR